MFKKMPFILAAVLLGVMLSGPFMPVELQQFLYAVSLTIKSFIILLLPFIVFFLLFKAAVMLSGGATRILALILVFVCASNFLSTFLSHYVGVWIYGFNLSMITPSESIGLKALWELNFPALIPNDKAMFSGIILGLIASKLCYHPALRLANYIEHWMGYVMRVIGYLIPLFVAGFVVKLQYDGVIGTIVKDYTAIFCLIALAQFSYILMAYFVLNNLKIQAFIASVRNMLPATISGFSTMSSAASMPLTIIGAESNADNKEIARCVVPATVNVHLVGDCFAIPIFAYAVLKSFGIAEPSLLNYLIFSFYFVLAKFSVAAIPGGGIIVMLPILEAYLGFDAPMMSLITALYVLFDPVITCANVLGNGAFAKMIDKLCLKVLGKVNLSTA
jgi:Na+/H+-dicarboxylate symporter